ncbi:MAG TPA: MarR family transcriptional regulator [Rhizobiaceae bacterium]|nr:MarR family transcriptional regulator [Rhizobiaceae bacterium]
MTPLAHAASELIRTNPKLAHEVRRQLDQKPVGGLTVRQRQVLDFIIDYQKKRVVAPTFSEIADGIGLGSKSGVNRIINALAERGYITHMPGRARSIVVLRVPE